MKSLTTKFPQFFPGISFLTIATAAFFGALSIDDSASAGDPGPASYPLFIIGLIFLCAAFLTFGRTTGQSEQDKELKPNKRLIQIVVALGLYIALLMPLGYLLATFLFVPLALWVAGERRPIMLGLYTFVVPSVIYYVFTSFLGVTLPSGLLEALL